MACELCRGIGIERFRITCLCRACGGSGRYEFLDLRVWSRDSNRAGASNPEPKSTSIEHVVPAAERPAVAPPSRFPFDPAVLYPAEIPPYALGPSIIPLRGDRS